MSYRIGERPKKPPRRTMQDATTPMRVYVTNGSDVEFAVPCWYHEVRPPRRVAPHHRDCCDHEGWPSPNHPDHICQEHHYASWHGIRTLRSGLDLRTVLPIHLRAEGYDGAWVDFRTDEKPSGITAEAWIDEDDDWVVRMRVEANDPAAQGRDERKAIPFALRIEAPAANGRKARTDNVALGEIIVLPAPERRTR